MFKTKLFSMLIVSICLLFSASITRADNGYMGANYGTIATDITDHTGMFAFAGYNFNDVLGFEARTLIDSSTDAYQGVEIEIESMWGVYVTGSLPMPYGFTPYGIFGHSEGKAKATGYGQSATADDSSTSVGFGVKYAATGALTVRAEYMQYFDDIDSMSVAAVLNF